MELETDNLKPSEKINLIKKGNTIVLYHASYCGYCKNMYPEWNKIIEINDENKLCNIVSIEKEEVYNNNPKNPLKKLNKEFTGFPTIRFYKGKNLSNNHLFEDERTKDNILNFIKKYAIKTGGNLKKKKNTKTKKKKNKKNGKKTNKRKLLPKRKLPKKKEIDLKTTKDYERKEINLINKAIRRSKKIKDDLIKQMNTEFKI
jgi:hypothetical protein